MATAYDDFPTALCSCGISFHDRQGERVRHEAKWHSYSYPAEYRLFDQRDEVAVEIEFWEAVYTNTEETTK